MKTAAPVEYISSERIDVKLPRSWRELSDAQLLLFCELMTEWPADTARFIFFMRLMDMRIACCVDGVYTMRIGRFVVEYSADEILGWFKQLDYLKDYNSAVRPSRILGGRAVHPLIQNDLTFGDFVHLENWWYAYLTTRELCYLSYMGRVLYRLRRPRIFSAAQSVAVLIWYTGLKQELTTFFPKFFGRSSAEKDFDGREMLAIVDAEIRALTGGDVTKENAVLSTPLWRALSELNAKAREGEELEKLTRK